MAPTATTDTPAPVPPPASSTTLPSSVLVLYASQTGNAESIATHIASEAGSRGYDSRCFKLDDHEKADLPRKGPIVFIVSTTGDGDPPDNATKFWRWLRRGKKELVEECFKGRDYTVLGLGDTNYTNFCQTAKRLDRKMVELGAKAFYPRGLADDGTGLEQVVDTWVEGLWDALPRVASCDEDKLAAYLEKGPRKGFGSSTPEHAADAVTAALTNLSLSPNPWYEPVKLNIPLPTPLPSLDDLIAASPAPPKPSSTLTRVTPAPDLATSPSPYNFLRRASLSSSADPKLHTADHPHPATLTSHRSLTTAGALKRVIEVTLQSTLFTTWTDFVPGDAIAVLAPNDPRVVDPLLTRLAFPTADLESRFSAPSGTPLAPLQPFTAREALAHLLDLTAPPRKHLLRLMADLATDEAERRTLLHLTTPAGAAAFRALKSLKPTLSDILHTFPSVAGLPLDVLCEHLPRLQPRSYSVAALDIARGEVKLAFNVVEYVEQGTGRIRRGHASGWMDDIAQGGGGDLPVFIRPVAAFRVPAVMRSRKGVIMIAAGTGLTPFMAHMGARVAAAGAEGLGEAWMFHGRRFEASDRIYGDEVDAHVSSGSLTRFVQALSRDRGVVGNAGKYVQDAIRAHREDVWRLIDGGAGVYVCGTVAMAREVDKAIVEVGMKVGGLENAEMKEFLATLTREGKYLKDLWG
ncbi:hypothetical protein HK101_003800 [Irineochytrium annulatum]|nr:hypothetical protein HK101_003800 [Irineochytrium annulatum]